MDFSPSARCQELMAVMRAFLDEVVYPAEPVFRQQVEENRAAGEPFQTPAVMGRLKEAAQFIASGASSGDRPDSSATGA